MTSDEYNQGVKQWADDIYRFAVHSCGDETRSQDAVQEAFASLWEHRKDISTEKGKSYLLSTAYHTLSDEWRHDKVLRNTTPELASLQSESHNPAEQFDLRNAIERALQTLPEVQRAILVLKDIEGYSYKEIENILMISDQQVCVYLYRARVALKRQLKDYEYNA